MKAVILAAGRGTRMGGLTEEIPKPLLRVLDKTLLEHKLEQLPKDIREVIIVVGYLGDKIKDHLGTQFGNKKISYVVQDALLGTADALWRAKHLLKDRFIVMMGDDLYYRSDIENCLEHTCAVLVKKVDFLETGGKVVLKPDGSVHDIIEGDHQEKNALTSTGLFVLHPEIFNTNPVQIPGRKEFGLPQTILQGLNHYPLKVVESAFWLQITKPEDLKIAEKILKNF